MCGRSRAASSCVLHDVTVHRCACRKADKTLVKKAMIAADEWARINLYQRQIGEREGARGSGTVQRVPGEQGSCHARNKATCSCPDGAHMPG